MSAQAGVTVSLWSLHRSMRRAVLLVSYAHRMKTTTCEMQTEEENSALFHSDCRKANMGENIKEGTLASIPSPKEICFSQLRTGWACVSQQGWSYWYEQHWDPLDWRQLHTKKELISTSCEAWTAEGETPQLLWMVLKHAREATLELTCKSRKFLVLSLVLPTTFFFVCFWMSSSGFLLLCTIDATPPQPQPTCVLSSDWL